MKFWEALKALEEGKKIRRKGFDHMPPHGFGRLVFCLTHCCEDEIRSWLSADWEVFEDLYETKTDGRFCTSCRSGQVLCSPPKETHMTYDFSSRKHLRHIEQIMSCVDCKHQWIDLLSEEIP